jgi:hypothetical protein
LKSFNELREAWLSSKDGPREKSLQDSLEKAREYIVRAKEEVKAVEEHFIRERLLALGDYLWEKGKPQ